MANNEYGTTWWGRRWLNALSGIDYENRIPRGKDYADAGKVRSLRIDEEKGEVKARVTGHYDPFYGVKITLPPIDKSDVARLVDRLAESPLIVARLAARELSPEIADIAESLGIRIFPTSWKDLEMSCTCPDWAVPCKHIAAAIYKLSEEIDANPFLLFTLRGIDLIAEMESRGVELEKAVEAEMPSWDDLIRGLDERDFVTDLHPDGESDAGWLEDLRKQTFRTFKVDGEKIRNLFAEHPAGYIHGNLRALTGRIVSEAGKLVAHQMRTVIERPSMTRLGRSSRSILGGSLLWTNRSSGANDARAAALCARSYADRVRRIRSDEACTICFRASSRIRSFLKRRASWRLSTMPGSSPVVSSRRARSCRRSTGRWMTSSPCVGFRPSWTMK